VSENRLAARRWPIAVVRVLAVVIMVQVLTQAALAGGFITGNVGLLGLHSANAILLVLTSGALLPAAILLLRPGRGPWWPIVFSIVLWLAITTQAGFGFARQIGLHIPLGMAIMGLIAAFTWWAFSHRPAARPALQPPRSSSSLAAASLGPAAPNADGGEPALTELSRQGQA
jgi:hypothetical protein